MRTLRCRKQVSLLPAVLLLLSCDLPTEVDLPKEDSLQPHILGLGRGPVINSFTGTHVQWSPCDGTRISGPEDITIYVREHVNRSGAERVFLWFHGKGYTADASYAVQLFGAGRADAIAPSYEIRATRRYIGSGHKPDFLTFLTGTVYMSRGIIRDKVGRDCA